MDVNRLISYTLRIGVIASAVLAVIGLASWAVTGLGNLGAVAGNDLSKTIVSGLQGNASGLVYLAVGVLIATPVLRVALSTVYFAYEGDRKYVLITVIVLAMLLFALSSGSISGG